MSAFCVDPEHINAMLTAAFSLVGHQSVRAWHASGVRYELTYANATAVGQMLILANEASVAYRYTEEAESATPLYLYRPVPVSMLDQTTALKLVACYEYQSCERPDWDGSEAQGFCRWLRHNIIAALPGYDAAPWHWTEDHSRPKRAKV
jgi:hypothetical protein